MSTTQHTIQEEKARPRKSVKQLLREYWNALGASDEPAARVAREGILDQLSPLGEHRGIRSLKHYPVRLPVEGDFCIGVFRNRFGQKAMIVWPLYTLPEDHLPIFQDNDPDGDHACDDFKGARTKAASEEAGSCR